MDGGGIQRIVAALDAQETGTLFEGLWAEARDLEQLLTIAERTLFIAMRHYVLCQGLAQPRDSGQ